MSYEKGFNHGYLIEKYQPKFAKAIGKEMGSLKEYSEGFNAGRAEYEKEKAKTKLSAKENPLKSTLKDKQQLKTSSKSKDKGLEK